MMDSDRQSKRRPLPTPNTSPSPDASQIATVASVPTANFYGDTPLPPPPPPRPKQTPGSVHTGFHYIPASSPADPTPSSPPPYEPSPFHSTLSDAKWRSPELVQEVDVREDDIPELVSTEEVGRGVAVRDPSPPFQDLNLWAPGAGVDWVAHAQQVETGVKIDGCIIMEELNWWDPDVRLRAARPGPGILPTLLADKFHDSDHSLFSVTVNPPNVSSPQSASPSATSTPPQPPFHIPTIEEVHEAVPHPNAMYCRKENGWILFVRRSTSELPPLATSFQMAHPGVLFPHPYRRKVTNSCVDETGENPSSRANLTHHFHCYPGAVSSHSLNPPFDNPPWESLAHVTHLPSHLQSVQEEEDKMEGIEPATSNGVDTEGVLLDLYVCCQCSVYVVCSHLIPGIVPARYFEELVQERADNPMPGQSKHDAPIIALDTTMKYG